MSVLVFITGLGEKGGALRVQEMEGHECTLREVGQFINMNICYFIGEKSTIPLSGVYIIFGYKCKKWSHLVTHSSPVSAFGDAQLASVCIW